ncbi:nuclear transport factor 2 family protein [Aspergillus undulatus]|uniref:nuclear transport factor 2 family protein n=1 Tax=Aspergillus undulatus TaxID=1810928 RepID=UPI003CCD5743
MSTSTTTVPVLPHTLTPPLDPRSSITDTLYRAVLAFDTNDSALLHSSLTEDATFDLNGRVCEGLPAIHRDCFDRVGRLNTMHFVTNVRVHIYPSKDGDADGDGEKAALTASSLSQHFREGEGLGSGKEVGTVEERLMAGNFYYCDLIKEGSEEGGVWKIQKFIVKSTWAEGEWGVMSGK